MARDAWCVVHGTWCDARACAWCMRMVRVYGVCACPVHALCMPCACPVHAVYAGEPVQHAAAIDDPRVQVAGQQKVELLQEQRGGQTDSEEAERSAVEEEGPHAC